MKKLLIVSVLFLLAGCAGTPNNGGVKEVQDMAAKICRFVPTFQTVTDIFLSGSAVASTALSVASAICNAVTINPLADGPGAKNYKPTVAGVRVKGSFIK